MGRFGRAARSAGLMGLSVLVVAGLVGYASAPSGDAIAAEVSAAPSRAGHEAIEGRVLQNGDPAQGTEVSIRRRTAHGTKPAGKATIGKSGRFSITAAPGRYVVLIAHGGTSKQISVHVKAKHSVFIEVTIKRANGHGIIAPVIFNY